jgi:hypothetical protein
MMEQAGSGAEEVCAAQPAAGVIGETNRSKRGVARLRSRPEPASNLDGAPWTQA